MHAEDIWRASSEEDSEEAVALNMVLNQEIQLEKPDQNESQQKKTCTSSGQPNRKRVVVLEQANTVRTVPRANNGNRQRKRYSTEPTWLDRYKTQSSDEVYPGSDMHSWLQALRS